MVRRELLLGMTVCCLFHVGCQGPRPAEPVLRRPVLGIEPQAATVTAGRVQKFTCAVSGGAGEGVVWKVVEPSGGSVDASGQYRAPSAPGTYTVEAVLRSGPPTARAKVTVVAAPSGPIAAPALVLPGATGLVASVPAVAGSNYAWTVQGGRLLEGANAAAMRFEAGTGPKVVVACRITNAAGAVLNSSLEIPMAEAVSLSITPRTTILTVGRGMKFGFELRGGTSAEVLWSVGTPEGGSVTGDGKYTAPVRPGRYDVQVAAKDDPGKVARASVKVVAEPAGAITAPAQLKAGASGLEASVPFQDGMTYAWDVSGGTLTAGAKAPAITFRAGTGAKVTLRCRIHNEAGDVLLVTKVLDVTP
jgi:hypothetical protein